MFVVFQRGLEKMNFITFYTSDGTLNMPVEKKEEFRQWAKLRLQNAFPDYEISISQEPSTKIFEMYCKDESLDSVLLKRFIKRLFEIWEEEEMYKKGET